MKMTSVIVSAPLSDYLLVEQDLKLVSPITYATGGDLKHAVKVSFFP
jgi:hypothetical protein